MRTALILGGGAGGLVAANRLRRLLPATDRVVIIDREPDHLFQPSLLWLAVGWREEDRIRRPLERLRRKGIEVVTAEVTRIDAATRTVMTAQGTFTGDALIIALGADLFPDAIPGLSGAGFDLYTLAGARGIRSAIGSMRGGRLVLLTGAPAYKCPAAPYEAALLIDAALRRRGVREAVRLELHAAEPGPMGVAGPAVSAAVRGLVESRGIAYHAGRQVTQADAATRRLTFADGTTVDFDTLVYVPPHRAPAVVRDAGLTNATGWIPVDRATLATAMPGVYALGDVTTIPLSMGKPLPKAGVFAHGQAEVVAANIARVWRGGTARRTFDGHGSCFIETGDGRAGMGAGNFFGEPAPRVRLYRPRRVFHWAKVLLERHWLSHWF